MRISENIAKIELLFGIYESFIKFQNSRNYNDINKDCEDIFCELLNRIYNYELKNANSHKYFNYPAIDLLDEKNRIFFQVTSVNERKKIIQTIEKFRTHFPKYKKEKIHVLILGTKKKYKPFNENVSVVDFKDLIREIDSKKEEQLCIDVVDILIYRLNLEKIIAEGFIIELKENTKWTPAKNYKKIIDWAFGSGPVSKADKNSLVEDLEDFIDKIRSLTDKVRQMITVAVTNCILEDKTNSYNETIVFDLIQLYSRYEDKNSVGSLIGILENKKQLYTWADDDNPYRMFGRFSFIPKSKSQDCLYLVYKFCQEKNIDIGKILVDLCFEYFDE